MNKLPSLTEEQAQEIAKELEMLAPETMHRLDQLHAYWQRDHAAMKQKYQALIEIYSNLICSGNYTGNPLLAKLKEKISELEG